MGSKLRINSKVRKKCCGRGGMPLASMRTNKLPRVESQAWVGVLLNSSPSSVSYSPPPPAPPQRSPTRIKAAVTGLEGYAVAPGRVSAFASLGEALIGETGILRVVGKGGLSTISTLSNGCQ